VIKKGVFLGKDSGTLAKMTAADGVGAGELNGGGKLEEHSEKCWPEKSGGKSPSVGGGGVRKVGCSFSQWLKEKSEGPREPKSFPPYLKSL
jgi:hypothetical protein